MEDLSQYCRPGGREGNLRPSLSHVAFASWPTSLCSDQGNRQGYDSWQGHGISLRHHICGLSRLFGTGSRISFLRSIRRPRLEWCTFLWSMIRDLPVSLYGSTALCWALAAFSVSSSFYTVGRTPWTGDLPSQGRYLHTGQHRQRINADKYPCLKWDSNPRSQCLSERTQFMP
jgi:hypothetical protein